MPFHTLRMTRDQKPWQVLARRTVYDSEWIGVQQVDIRMPDGETAHDVHFVDYKRPAAGVIPVRDDGSILLIDHYRFQTDTRGWEIPAGRIEAGESAEQAVGRELREETGHRATSIKFIGKYHPTIGSSNQTFHIFIARGVRQSGEIEDRNEVMGLRWFSREEVKAMIAGNEHLDGLSLTAMCWAMVLGEI
jgi:8-oxo-dGDP phosphatase